MEAKNNEPDTLPNLDTLIEIVQAFRQDVMARLSGIETNIASINENMIGLEVRQDRLLSQVHEIGAATYNNRADIKVLTEEVRAWAKDVMGLRHEFEGVRR